MEAAEAIARGGTVEWEQEFQHPTYGPLKFRAAGLPTALQWLAVAALSEQIAPGVTGGQGMLLAEAVAGILRLLDRPVIREERVEDPDNPGHEKLRQWLYDPRDDVYADFPLVVWGGYNVWRTNMLSVDMMEQVKNLPGAPDSSSGSEPVAPSPDVTV